MKFNNRLKGSVTQALFDTLLKDAGYCVVPLGIESVIREVQSLSAAEYLSLELSENLRCLPDYFVHTPEFDKTFLVEVKFRQKWNAQTRAELKTTIEQQVKRWKPLYFVLFLSHQEGTFPSHNLKVIKLTEKDGLVGKAGKIPHYKDFLLDTTPSHYQDYFIEWDKIEWSAFERFQDVFVKTSETFDASTIEKSVELVKAINPILVKSDKK